MEAAYGTLRLKSDHEDRDKVPSEIVLSSAEHQIGRSNPSSASAAAHTHINLQYISGVHCIIRRTANRVELEDRSSNGTFVTTRRSARTSHASRDRRLGHALQTQARRTSGSCSVIFTDVPRRRRRPTRRARATRAQRQARGGEQDAARRGGATRRVDRLARRAADRRLGRAEERATQASTASARSPSADRARGRGRRGRRPARAGARRGRVRGRPRPRAHARRASSTRSARARARAQRAGGAEQRQR